jgi:hypothetical protein
VLQAKIKYIYIMHIDKKLIAVIIGSALVGGMIGGGIGGAIGSFAGGHGRGGREGGYRSNGRMMGWNSAHSYRNLNVSDGYGIPQAVQVNNAVQPINASTTRVK